MTSNGVSLRVFPGLAASSSPSVPFCPTLDRFLFVSCENSKTIHDDLELGNVTATMLQKYMSCIRIALRSLYYVLVGERRGSE